MFFDFKYHFLSKWLPLVRECREDSTKTYHGRANETSPIAISKDIAAVASSNSS